MDGEHGDRQEGNENTGPGHVGFDCSCSQESNHENSFSTVAQCLALFMQSEETVSQEPVLLYTRNFGVWLQYNKERILLQQEHCFITTECMFFLI